MRIGNQWNAIRIIALSQNNPLKAIAEFVENSIDAGAENISVVRGKTKGEQYLKVIDDGEGVRDFHYLATHIGDSIKRKLKEHGAEGIQGEFGIGLLSFWTVGEELLLSSCSEGGEAKRLHLVKDSPDYAIHPSRELFERPGTTLHIQPLLPGIKAVSGEKIQSYLASELRDRIARSGVSIRIIDRSSRKDLLVEPRRFHGQLLHGVPEPRTPRGEVLTEFYLTDPSSCGGVGLYKLGTRVLPDVSRTEAFRRPPWTSGYIEGIIDASFIQLTPGTRDGVVYDDAFESLLTALAPVEKALTQAIEEHRRAEEAEASRAILKRITKALREAFSMLPAEEYGWLSAAGGGAKNRKGAVREGGAEATGGVGTSPEVESVGPGGSLDTLPPGQEAGEETAGEAVYPQDPSIPGITVPHGSSPSEDRQRAFFEFPGPLYRLDLTPTAARVGVGKQCDLRAVPRDKSRRTIDADVSIFWELLEGKGALTGERGEFVGYVAPDEPELARIRATAQQGEILREAEAVVTVTAELGAGRVGGVGAIGRHGLPGYTYRYAPGELWRSTYDLERALITVNSGHADFVYASRQSASKLRYLGRLFAKEIVLANFPGAPREELLERMVELEVYMDGSLR